MIIQARTDHEEPPMTGYSLFLFVDIQSPESWQTEVTEVGHILLGKFLFREAPEPWNVDVSHSSYAKYAYAAC